MTGVLDVVAGWGLPGGVIDSVEPFEVSRHLPDVVEHRLLGVLTAAMRAGEIFVDDESAVLDAHSAAMAQVLLLEDMMLTAVDVLREAGVDVWLLKGAALAHLLADPGERTFGDNDLLVPANRLPAAVAALEKAGGRRAQPSLSDEWETRFAKSVTMRWKAGTELDLHRTLVPGPFGHMIDLDEVTVGSTRVTIADEAVRTLGPEIHLIHAAMHVALGDVTPRLGNVRDIAMLLDRTDLNLDSVMRTVVSWQAEAPFAAGLSAAGRLGAVHPLIDWADDRRRSRRERWLMACYAEREGRFRRQSLASLAVLSWRHKLAFARSVTASRRS